jgi:hypothetical protein
MCFYRDRDGGSNHDTRQVTLCVSAVAEMAMSTFLDVTVTARLSIRKQPCPEALVDRYLA